MKKASDMDPDPEPGKPPYVKTKAEIERWRLCVAIAVRMMQEPATSETVWHAARSLYRSDIPT